MNKAETPKRKRRMSAAGRAGIAATTKKAWAAVRAAKAKASQAPAAKTARRQAAKRAPVKKVAGKEVAAKPGPAPAPQTAGE